MRRNTDSRKKGKQQTAQQTITSGLALHWGLARSRGYCEDRDRRTN